jgi:hypothetical protein
MTVGLPEEAFQASIDLDILRNSRSFIFFLDSLCTIEASIVASTGVNLLRFFAIRSLFQNYGIP